MIQIFFVSILELRSSPYSQIGAQTFQQTPKLSGLENEHEKTLRFTYKSSKMKT